MKRITKKEMEEQFDELLNNIINSHKMEKAQSKAFFEKEALEYELKIAHLQGQIIVFREVLGMNREHIVEGIRDANQ